MAEARSLCRIDWKLGQALMPDHFLWQEDSLRREVEMRAEHQALPSWGLVELGWDETLLRATGRLLINRLELVFETGTLVDIPGNARPVSLDLPKPALEPIDVYVHLLSEPGDHQGGLVRSRRESHRAADAKACIGDGTLTDSAAGVSTPSARSVLRW
ncbi:MAG: type VI secretion system baseplate subunit TssK [Polyangiaceae bacterium]